jgi:hypothetical protein
MAIRDRNRAAWDSPSYNTRLRRGEATELFLDDGSIDADAVQDFAQVTIRIQPARNIKRFWRSDFYIEVTIGIDTSETHYGVKGITQDISYADLIAGLHFLGFDPLAPLRTKEVAESFKNMFLKDILYPFVNKSKFINAQSVSWWLPKRALLFRDLVRDYIRGQYSGINEAFSQTRKPELSPKTIATREVKQDKGIPYDMGINEALYETGQLEEAVEVISTKVHGKIYPMQKSSRKHIRTGGPSSERSLRGAYLSQDEVMRRRIQRADGAGDVLAFAVARNVRDSGIYSISSPFGGGKLSYIPKININRFRAYKDSYIAAAQRNLEEYRNAFNLYKQVNPDATQDQFNQVIKSDKQFKSAVLALKRAGEILTFWNRQVEM